MKTKVMLIALFLALAPASIRAGDEYRTTWAKAVRFLRKAQAEDGSWGSGPGKVGVTSINLEALCLAPAEIRESVGDMMAKAASYIASHQRDDGSIHDKHAPKNYCTSHAIEALVKYDKRKYAPVIAKAAEWVKSIQATEAGRFDPEKHVGYGGFGYGSTTRPDLNNSWVALSALKEFGVPGEDPLWEKALVFVKRCQNSTEVNDLEGDYIGDDGGAKYLPTDQEAGSVAGSETTQDGRRIWKSYGSISFGTLAAYLWIGQKKDDLTVRTIVGWLEKHYSLDANINTKKEGQEGRLGYYRVMAKALSEYGEKEFAGRDWARELAAMIAGLQRKDGSWVNEADRWKEGDPALATGYALAALAIAQRNLK